MAGSLFFVLFVLLCSFAALTAARKFDKPAAKVAVKLAGLAYCPTASYESKRFTDRSGVTVTKTIDKESTDVQGFVGYNRDSNKIYVVIRGTTSVRDWMNNLNARRVSYPHCKKCKVHAGFYKAEQSVIASVIKEVNHLRRRFPDYKVVVTGHSLGGAVATLIALDLQETGTVEKVQLITFGSPRVGNTKFAKAMSKTLKNHYRVTHGRDAVPRVPAHKPPLVYTHLKGEIFESKGKIVRCKGYEDKKCSYKYWRYNIKDHMTYLGVPLGTDECPQSLR